MNDPDQTKNLKILQSDRNPAYSGIDELWNIERCLQRYNSSLARKLSRHLLGKQEILEFGAGIGTLATIWQISNGVKPECLEIDSSLREILKTRGFKTYAKVEDISKTYHGIYTSNVLEHIDNDTDAIKTLSTLLKDDGLLIIYVPAFMCLYSSLDSAVGHYRRYERRELIKKLSSANFQVIEASYADSLGFIASLIVRFLYKQKSPLDSARTLRTYDSFIYPISSFLDFLGLRFFFGKNLLVIAKKFKGRPQSDNFGSS